MQAENDPEPKTAQEEENPLTVSMVRQRFGEVIRCIEGDGWIPVRKLSEGLADVAADDPFREEYVLLVRDAQGQWGDGSSKPEAVNERRVKPIRRDLAKDVQKFLRLELDKESLGKVGIDHIGSYPMLSPIEEDANLHGYQVEIKYSLAGLPLPKKDKTVAED